MALFQRSNSLPRTGCGVVPIWCAGCWCRFTCVAGSVISNFLCRSNCSTVGWRTVCASQLNTCSQHFALSQLGMQGEKQQGCVLPCLRLSSRPCEAYSEVVVCCASEIGMAGLQLGSVLVQRLAAGLAPGRRCRHGIMRAAAECTWALPLEERVRCTK
jgi:hypothetical protein